jgi:D-serine dehydratase
MQRAVTSDALDGRTKGLPAGIDALAPGAIASRGWNVLREDLPLPLALLKASSLDHNARWMRAFREAAGVVLAPHGKTSMSPELFRRQLADGAWGITVATVQQLRVAREAGVARVLMANQLVGNRRSGTCSTSLLATRISRSSPSSIRSTWSTSSPPPRARAEGGTPAVAAGRVRIRGRPYRLPYRGRSDGCGATRRRSRAAAAARGRGGYEGSVPGKTTEERESGIARFVAFMAEVARRSIDEELVDADPVLLSAGGSAYFDLVTALPRAVGDRRAEVVIRSGCYLTHDSDSYAKAAARMRERTPAVAALGEGLRDAIEIWSYVQSRPEPALAILTMGKRDVSHDLHLPFARWRFRPAQTGDHGVVGRHGDHRAQRPARLPDARAGRRPARGRWSAARSAPCTTFDGASCRSSTTTTASSTPSRAILGPPGRRP